MVLGGMCRSPGPSFSGRVGCDGTEAVSIIFPGRTNLSNDEAMIVECCSAVERMKSLQFSLVLSR
jgi:hypothetical protein